MKEGGNGAQAPPSHSQFRIPGTEEATADHPTQQGEIQMGEKLQWMKGTNVEKQ